MKTRIFVIVIFVTGLLCPCQSYGQWSVKKAAKKAFKKEDFQAARNLLYKYNNIDKNPRLLYYRAVSNYKTNHIKSATQDFIATYKLGNNDREVFWYLARILQSQKKYVLAINKYKAFLRSDPKDAERDKAIRNIKDCTTGLRQMTKESSGYVKPLTASINSEYNETNPIYSVNNIDVFYFSSDRYNNKYTICKGHKTYPPFNLMYDSTGISSIDYRLECFNPSGSKMIYRKIKDGAESLVVQEYDQNEKLAPYYYNSPMKIEMGDKDLILFRDSVILFSSNRPGGYGGYDLYVSIRNKGQWEDAYNLGSTINTTADESAPFLCTDGQKIYFSSDRINGFGANDIYTSVFIDSTSHWTVPVNLGSPLNSCGEEYSFKLSRDGTHGIFSSDRKSAKGGFDLYQLKLHQLEIAQHIKKEHIFTDYIFTKNLSPKKE